MGHVVWKDIDTRVAPVFGVIGRADLEASNFGDVDCGRGRVDAFELSAFGWWASTPRPEVVTPWLDGGASEILGTCSSAPAEAVWRSRCRFGAGRTRDGVWGR